MLTKRTALFVGAVAVLAVLAIAAIKSNASTTPSAEVPQHTPAVTATRGPVATPPPHQASTVSSVPTAAGQSDRGRPVSLDPVAAVEIIKVAKRFVEGYQARSRKDSSPTAWLARVRRVATPDFYAELRTQAVTSGGSDDWSSLVRNKEVLAVTAAPNQPVHDAGATYVGVPFTETATEPGQARQQYPGFLTVYVSLVRRGSGAPQWLVSGTDLNPPAGVGN